MTAEEKKKADEAAKAEQAKKEADAKAAKELADKEAEEKKKADEAAKAPLKGDFIMKVTHLSWGLNNKNHFYADKKPLINAKVMGKYANTLKIWLKAGWIEKGSY